MSFEEWDDSQPIYRQLGNRIVELIIDGTLKEGEAIPSVRQVASEYRINHLTVSKAYQALVDDGLLEKKRGLGMFILPGAKNQLLASEREKFFNTEVPALRKRLEQVNVSPDELKQLLLGQAESEE